MICIIDSRYARFGAYLMQSSVFTGHFLHRRDCMLLILIPNVDKVAIQEQDRLVDELLSLAL